MTFSAHPLTWSSTVRQRPRQALRHHLRRNMALAADPHFTGVALAAADDVVADRVESLLRQVDELDPEDVAAVEPHGAYDTFCVRGLAAGKLDDQLELDAD